MTDLKVREELSALHLKVKPNTVRDDQLIYTTASIGKPLILAGESNAREPRRRTTMTSALPLASTVASVSRDDIHRFSKVTQPQIHLLTGLGVEGDAHAGVTVKHRSRVKADPTQPNLRQVHLIHAELLEELAG